MHRIHFKFSSTDLISIRITTNDIVKIVQCRNEFESVCLVDLDNAVIKIENLTPGVACNIEQVLVNFIDVSAIAYRFFRTYSKSDDSKVGDFVQDIHSPDYAVVTFDRSFYPMVFQHFVDYQLIK